MAVPLAQVDDVAAVWREIDASEVARVTYLINLASAKLRASCPFDLDARMALFAVTPLDPIALDPVVVASVVATIVKRVLVNPDGLVSSTQTFGPISESRTFGKGSEVTGEVQVLPGDLAELLPIATRRQGRVRSLQVGLSPSMQPNDRWLRRGSYRPPLPIVVPELDDGTIA